MRRSSTLLLGLTLGWLLVTGMSALFLLSTSGTLWLATHDSRVASVVWPVLGVVIVSGLTLLLTVHVYVHLVLDDAVRP